ncbi:MULTISPECIES: biotin--[acetyl-CoA-carboxylase] ligase [unclassified Brevundimonas]|uniref:biotin--[acetyl-CoA-carboxylase] ligase n=1 Tax=unclassified Brevundimonas TaxID=2622653 RepID=UPI000C48C190|nr:MULTISPECIES: biotin--[acetyl-CoA-carboxylase] ligase [unclassified Brevundimonas]MAL88632.1 biotin--[acetyl-CoA-carboxylase] ligase [Brevundimonas sp.]MAL89721.1 biotin--[acetyl-CoA-carboxylase] ligase [Brevundimonas sp.]
MSPAELLVLDDIDSTNAEARRQAEAGNSGPIWIAARRQSSGRGRRGRAWSSQIGNLAATYLCVTHAPPTEAAQTSFIAALAVADLLHRYVPPACVTIKWPNDVMIEGMKASGILVESGPAPAGGLWLAVGIGVNLASAPQDVERPATAAAAHLAAGVSRAPTLDEALPVLAEAFGAWTKRREALGFEVIRDAWTRRAHGLNAPAVARLGHETVEGVAEGLADDGALRLRLADGSLRLISAGDVFFGESA